MRKIPTGAKGPHPTQPGGAKEKQANNAESKNESERPKKAGRRRERRIAMSDYVFSVQRLHGFRQVVHHVLVHVADWN